MIDLTPTQAKALSAIIKAGDQGLAYEDVSLSDALSLAIDGLVRPDRRARRLYATEMGRAFAARTAA